MSAVDQAFSRLRAKGGKAFLPFVTAGDPDLDFTLQALKQLGYAGATLCEVGIPYSDPIADGPVIQASYTRALEAGVTVPRILEALGGVAAELPIPLVAMVSYAIIHRLGPSHFVVRAKQAGVSGLIVPDLLVDEGEPLRAVCRHEDVSLTQLVTPTTPRERAVRIAASSTGFLYYVSVAGITGERHQLPPELVEDVSWLRARTELPICIGFGVSQPQQARQLAQVADGVIVGSALVRRIAQIPERSPSDVLSELTDFTRSMVDAMDCP